MPEGGGTSDIVLEVSVKMFPKFVIVFGVLPGLVDLLDAWHQGFGDEAATEIAEESVSSGALRNRLGKDAGEEGERTTMLVEGGRARELRVEKGRDGSGGRRKQDAL